MKISNQIKRGAPKGNQNAAKGDTERLPWRLPVEWGIRATIEKAAKAKKLKPAEVLKAHFGVQSDMDQAVCGTRVTHSQSML